MSNELPLAIGGRTDAARIPSLENHEEKNTARVETMGDPNDSLTASENEVMRIVVERDDDEYFASWTRYFSAEHPNGQEGGCAEYSSTIVGALAELCATLIKVDEDNAHENRQRDYRADELCPFCGVVKPCRAHTPEARAASIAESVQALEAASSPRAVDPQVQVLESGVGATDSSSLQADRKSEAGAAADAPRREGFCIKCHRTWEPPPEEWAGPTYCGDCHRAALANEAQLVAVIAERNAAQEGNQQLTATVATLWTEVEARRRAEDDLRRRLAAGEAADAGRPQDRDTVLRLQREEIRRLEVELADAKLAALRDSSFAQHKLEAADAGWIALTQQLQKENDELKARLARVEPSETIPSAGSTAKTSNGDK